MRCKRSRRLPSKAFSRNRLAERPWEAMVWGWFAPSEALPITLLRIWKESLRTNRLKDFNTSEGERLFCLTYATSRGRREEGEGKQGPSSWKDIEQEQVSACVKCCKTQPAWNTKSCCHLNQHSFKLETWIASKNACKENAFSSPVACFLPSCSPQLQPRPNMRLFWCIAEGFPLLILNKNATKMAKITFKVFLSEWSCWRCKMWTSDTGAKFLAIKAWERFYGFVVRNFSLSTFFFQHAWNCC